MNEKFLTELSKALKESICYITMNLRPLSKAALPILRESLKNKGDRDYYIVDLIAAMSSGIDCLDHMTSLLDDIDYTIEIEGYCK